MTKKDLTFVNAPKALFDFECENFSAIYPLTIEGWNIWQVCKLAVFYNKIRANADSSTPVKSSRSSFDKILKISRGIVAAVLGFFTLIVKTRRNKTVYFVTNTVDKLVKNKEGKFYNSLMYPILDEKVISDYLILETPVDKGFLKPSVYSHHVNAYGFDLVTTFISKFQNSAQLELTCNSLCNLLNQFFSDKGFSDRVDVAFIQKAVTRFLAERNVYKFLFSFTRPQLIISSEKMTTGLMAAALESSIPFFEFQHGAMDEYYPHYIWDSRFLTSPKVMKPTKLLVFGKLAKDIVLKTRYFKEDEVVELGYQKVDLIRETTTPEQNGSSGQVLVVMQPLMHQFNVNVLKTLKSLALPTIQINVKAHPLQPQTEIEEYESLIEGQANMTLLDKKQNIHQLIFQSDLVIGYLSTTLEEAVSLGKPSLTIVTEDAPKGIHSITGSDCLIEAIRPVALSNVQSVLHDFYTDKAYKDKWLEDVRLNKYAVYQSGYKRNIRILLTPFTR